MYKNGIYKDRIGELLGAVGNLHISLFEILFKNPFTLQEHHLLEELEAGGQEGTTYTRFG